LTLLLTPFKEECRHLQHNKHIEQKSQEPLAEDGQRATAQLA